LQVTDKDKSLKCITTELIDSGRQLQDVTDKKVECLKAFVSHKKFSDWLKKSLRGMCLLNCNRAWHVDGYYNSNCSLWCVAKNSLYYVGVILLAVNIQSQDLFYSKYNN